MRIPFFHYTSIDNLPSILMSGRLVSRSELNKNRAKFNDISIDPDQPVRKKLGLLNYIPLFAGFFTSYKFRELNNNLRNEYDNPMVQNKSFYGSLNQTLQTRMGDSYEKVVILLVNDELVYKFADQGKIRFFTDIAIKHESEEKIVTNRWDLQNCLEDRIEGSYISGEIDVLDNGAISIRCIADIEAIIVDNDRIKSQVLDMIAKYGTNGVTPLVLVTQLPRNPTSIETTPFSQSHIPPTLSEHGDSVSLSPVVTDEQKAFANYVENLKRNGITGEKYREKIAEWRREHNKD